MEETKQVYAFNLLTGEYDGPKTLDNTDRSPISGAGQIPCNMIEETKQVYAVNLLTGEYEGPKTLDNTDRSPISGAWQIPCNTVEVAPPEIPEDHKCLWDGTQWILKEIEKPKDPEIPEATQIPESTSQTPSLSERIAVLEDAVNTLMEGVATNG